MREIGWLLAVLVACSTVLASKLPGFEAGTYAAEQVKTLHVEDGVRILINAPAEGQFDSNRPTLLVIYALPNGNSIEQTMGAKFSPGMDWHFDIQHIAAQTRKMREIDAGENVVVALAEAPGKSWPTYRAKYADHPARVKRIVESIEEAVAAKNMRVAIVAHSGGGGFISSFLNSGDAIPDNVALISYLDADYSYSDDEHHGDKLLAWLKGDATRRLVVFAYDDRNIQLNGKPVITSPTGGTFRATHRMIDRVAKDEKVVEGKRPPFDEYSAMAGRIEFFIHPNPENKILHTVMIGEMNGYLEALTAGTPLEKQWGQLGGPRAYSEFLEEIPAAKLVQDAKQNATTRAAGSALPQRRADMPGGRAFIARIAKLSPAEREAGTLQEILAGNIPDSSRRFKTVTVAATLSDAAKHTIQYEVSCDYVAIGGNEDSVRMPMRPQTAEAIAHACGCELPTRKMCNDIWAAADVKVDPLPMTVDRESAETFLAHSVIIDEQINREPAGLLIAGDKKDIVISNRVFEKPGRVLIYGWHRTSGKAIQPLTNVHGDFYMDYSHGVRLVRREMLVDGKKMIIDDVLADLVLSGLLSDEGVMKSPWYR